MDSFEFNRTIESRWGQLYNAQEFTNSEIHGGILYRELYMYSFITALNLPHVSVNEIMSRTEEDTCEWLKGIIKYIEDNEDMIYFWLL